MNYQGRYCGNEEHGNITRTGDYSGYTLLVKKESLCVKQCQRDNLCTGGTVHTIIFGNGEKEYECVFFRQPDQCGPVLIGSIVSAFKCTGHCECMR